jgi:pilus assembly protein CpaE
MASISSQIRLLLVEDVTQVSQYIRNLLNSQEQVKLLDVLTRGDDVLDQIRQLRPDILMVDALLQGRVNGLEVAERVRQAGMTIPIIAMTVPQKPIRIGPGMGIVKVLSMPFSGYDFMNTLVAANSEHRAQSPESVSRTFAVFGAKGGVGTTTLAYNIAVAAAQSTGLKVALVDGSLQFGDLRGLLRVPENAPSFLQLPTDRVTETDLTEVLWRDPSGIDILLAPPRVEMAEMVTVRDVEKVLSLLRRVYNLVIIDTPTTVTDMTLTFFDACDAIMLVVTTDFTTVRNTRMMNQAFEMIGFTTERLRVVLNRSDAVGGLTENDYLEMLGRSPEFRVVSDGRVVLDANNQGVPFVLQAPDAPISRDVSAIASALTIPAAMPAVPVGARR